MNFKWLVVFFIYIVSAANAQQRPMFTSYMFNGLAINPAYSAVDEALNITGLARQQWVGFLGAPNTQTLTFHSPIKTSNTSIGFILVHDVIGQVITEKTVNLTLAQRVLIGEDAFLAAGFSGGITNFQANYSEIPNGGEGSDPVFANVSQWRASVGLGALFFTSSCYIGLSSPQLFYRDIDSIHSAMPSTSSRPNFLLSGGYLFRGENFTIKPNVLLKYMQASDFQYDLNLNFLIAESVWLGFSYRSAESIGLLAQVYILKDLSVGYAYDYNISPLASAQKGSHEVMLQFRAPVRGKNFPRCYF